MNKKPHNKYQVQYITVARKVHGDQQVVASNTALVYASFNGPRSEIVDLLASSGDAVIELQGELYPYSTFKDHYIKQLPIFTVGYKDKIMGVQYLPGFALGIYYTQKHDLEAITHEIIEILSELLLNAEPVYKQIHVGWKVPESIPVNSQ